MKYVDVDKVRAEIERRYDDNLTADKKCPQGYFGAAAKEDYDILAIIERLQLEQEEQKELPTLRQAIEEYMYDLLVRKIPGCPDGAGIEVRATLTKSTVKKLKKDYEQNGIPATATGKVFTNTDPMNLYVDSDQWAALLGQFDNGQRVRIILVKEDAE